METKQVEQSIDQRDAWSEHVFDALPFMFAAFVVVIVLLSMMSPSIGNIYSNIVTGLGELLHGT